MLKFVCEVMVCERWGVTKLCMCECVCACDMCGGGGGRREEEEEAEQTRETRTPHKVVGNNTMATKYDYISDIVDTVLKIH